MPNRKHGLRSHRIDLSVGSFARERVEPTVLVDEALLEHLGNELMALRIERLSARGGCGVWFVWTG
jgi:hypothetical protein